MVAGEKVIPLRNAYFQLAVLIYLMRKTKFLMVKLPGSTRQRDRDGDMICVKRLIIGDHLAGWFIQKQYAYL